MNTRALLIGVPAMLLLHGAFAQDGGYRQLDSLFKSWYATGKFSGNVLIADHGRPFYQRSFGLANEASGQPLNDSTMFLLGSVSKQFTAFGVVLLKDQGRLRLDDAVRDYLPLLPYPGITIRQLLTHTSGVPDYFPLMEKYWDRSRFATNQDMLAMLIKYRPPVLFRPGLRYEYSNTGYALLALVIEKVSGLSYARFMEEMVFHPLGMNRTMVYTRRAHPRAVKNYALGYVFDEGSGKFVLPDSSDRFKDGLWEDGVVGEDGVNSTTDDLLIWDRALYHNRLLRDSSLATIFTPQRVDSGLCDYGFGWHIKTIPPYGRISYHSGGWPGYIAYIERHLDSDKTILVLRNKFIAESPLPIDAIRAVLYGRPANSPSGIPVPDSLLVKYTGTYRLTERFAVTIAKQGAALTVQGTNQRALFMTATAINVFFVPGPDATIEFVVDPSGRVPKLILHQKGQTVDGVREK